uniref:Putative methyltransferase n=1 Tax=viral metagenome TaxID=1070528 RepID=A0A6M3IE50_9ZZZZ
MNLNPKNLKPNPISISIYGEEEMDETFILSIKEKGVLVPVYIKKDNTIISGHRRVKAAVKCELETIPIIVLEFPDEIAERSAIIEYNKQRKKTLTQIMREAEEIEFIESENSKKRMLAGKKVDPVRVSAQGKTRDIVAKNIGMKRDTYEKAKKIYKNAKSGNNKAEDALKKIDAGELSIHKAYSAIKKDEIKAKAKQVEFPKGKYRIIYADPPWKYGSDRIVYGGDQEEHYPCMTIKELCAMPISDITEDNAVLFLWVTSPILEESFDIIRAWSFEYKTSFIWDKVKHNMGYYNSVRHELLLVCTRGSCLPDVKKLFDSVHTEERTEHSTKPEHFRMIIDTIYPEGNRIELFARKQSKGWKAYGNECKIS